MSDRHTGPKGIDWDAQPLGVVPDAEIARRLGVSPVSVGQARAKRGIDRVELASPAKRRVLDSSDRVGAISDRALAAELGVCAKTVRAVRRELGRPPASRSGLGVPGIHGDWHEVATALREKGHTLQEIADAAGVSKQRVHQYLAKVSR